MLHSGTGNLFWWGAAQLQNLAQRLLQPTHTLRELGNQQFGDPGTDLIEVVNPECTRHAFTSAKDIDRQGNARAIDGFKQQSRATRSHDTGNDFGDLAVRINRCCDTP